MWLISENQKLLIGTISTTKFKCVFYKAVYKQLDWYRQASLIIVVV